MSARAKTVQVMQKYNVTDIPKSSGLPGYKLVHFQELLLDMQKHASIFPWVFLQMHLSGEHCGPAAIKT